MAFTQDAIDHINIKAVSAGTNIATNGTVVFSNSNNISFGMDTNGIVTASASQASQTIQTANLVAVGNTTGSTSATTFNTNLSFSGASGVSVGFSGDTVIISGGGGGGGGNLTISAGANSLSSGTVFFSNSNGVSFGMGTNGVVTASTTQAAQTIQSGNLVAVGNTTGSTSSTTYNTNLSLSGAGGLSVGYSGDTVILSGATTAAQSVQTLGLYAVGNTTGGTSSETADARTVSFDGAGGVSVGFSGGSVIISGATTAAQSIQTANLVAVGNTTGSTSSTTFNTNLSFSGAGNALVGFSGDTVIISATSSQSVQTEGYSAVGNTTGGTSSTSFNSNFSLSGAGGVSVGFSGQSIIISGATTASQSVQTEGWSAVGNTTGSTSSTTFNSNFSISGAGIASVGYSGNTIIVSASSNQSVQTEGWSAVGNTTASTSSTSFNSNFSISGAGGASVGFSGQSIVFSAPATSAHSSSAVGNTTGSTSSTTLGNIESVSGAGIVSVGFSGQTLIISASSNQSVQTEGWSAVGNTTGSTSSTSFNSNFSVSGAGIASVGFSGQSIIVSAPARSETVVGNTTGSTSSTTFGAVESISGAGAVSVGFSGNTLIISGATGAGGGGPSSWFASGNTTGSTSSTSMGTSISISGAAGASIGFSGQTMIVSANSGGAATAVGNTTGATSSTTFNSSGSISGAGGVSVGFSGQTIIISGPNSGAISALSQSVVGNTTGSTSSTTFGNIESISGAGAVSVGFSGQTLIISGATAAGAALTLNSSAVGNTTGSTSSTTFGSSGSISGAGGVSVGFSGDTVIISGATTAAQTIQTANIVAVGNTTGSTSSTTFNTNLSFSGAGGASVGFSGDTVIISGATTAAQTIQTANIVAVGNTTGSTSSTTFNTNLSFSGAGGASVGFSGDTIIISGATGGAGGGVTLSKTYFPVGFQAIGTQLGNAIQSSNVYIQYCPIPVGLSISRAAVVLFLSARTTAAASSGSWSATLAIGLYTRNGTSYSTVLTSSVATSETFSSTQGNVFGAGLITIPFVTSLPPNEYWAMFNISTATGGALSATQSLMAFPTPFNQIGTSFNGGNNIVLGMGTISTSSFTLPASLGMLTAGGSALSLANYFLQLDNYSVT